VADENRVTFGGNDLAAKSRNCGKRDEFGLGGGRCHRGLRA
jgi:hypothetical protein